MKLRVSSALFKFSRPCGCVEMLDSALESLLKSQKPEEWGLYILHADCRIRFLGWLVCFTVRLQNFNLAPAVRLNTQVARTCRRLFAASNSFAQPNIFLRRKRDIPIWFANQPEHCFFFKKEKDLKLWLINHHRFGTALCNTQRGVSHLFCIT